MIPALQLLAMLIGATPAPVEGDASAALPPRFERWTDAEVELPLLSLTVSGGVSLGSYEAGYLYYLMLAAKLNPQLLDPRVFTGASAGSVNALLALMASCSAPDFKANDNLFFNVWIPIGTQGLFDKNRSTAISVFNTEPLLRSTAKIAAAWAKGLDSSCDVMLGVTTTRVTAEPVDLVGGRVRLPRTEAKFSLRVRGVGLGSPPHLSNYVNPLDPVGLPMLPAGDDGQISFAALAQAILASTAFPLVFPPQPISYCTNSGRLLASDNPNLVPRCDSAHAVSSLFYDGGVIDNQPLRLAVQLATRGFFRDGALGKWRPVPSLALAPIPHDAVFLYMDPDTGVLPELTLHDPPPLEGAVDYGLYLAGQLVGSVRTKELQSLLEDSPGVKRQIGTTLTYFRPLSSSLGNFFGLFERDIRIHDYYLGMHDASRFLQEVVVPWSGSKSLVMPEDAAAKSADAGGSWQAFGCMRAVFDGAQDPAICQGLDRNLLVAMQVTLDTLYARCERVFDDSIRTGAPAPSTVNEHCRAAMASKPPPKVPGVEGDEQWRYTPREEESFDHQLRRLSAYGFIYRDLGLDQRQAKYARRKLARAINEVTNELAAKQGQGLLVSTVGRTLAQYMAYAPPDHAFSFMFGTRFEAAYSFTRGESAASWLRFDLALGAEGLTTVLGASSNRFFALTPKIGFELEPTALSGQTLQWRAGARAGFQFSTHDGFARDRCDALLPCSRLVVEPFVAVTLFQWARVQVGIDLLPPMRGLPWALEFRPSVGAELDLP